MGLAEHGWKPHRDLSAQKKLLRTSIYWHTHEQDDEKQGVRFIEFEMSTILFQRYSANLSVGAGGAAPAGT